MRSILGNPLVQFLIGRTIGLYMLFVGVTTRWTLVNRAAVEPFWRAGGGAAARPGGRAQPRGGTP